MRMTSRRWISQALAGLAGGKVATAYSERKRTQGLIGGESSTLRPGTPLAKPPSIERSPTNSTVLITVQAEPEPPLVFSQEPVSGSWPLHQLTVLYVPSLEDLGLPTPPSGSSDSNTATEPLTGPDDPRWIAMVEHMRGKR